MLNTNQARWIKQNLIEILAPLFILALAGYLRLVNVAHNPAWYTDEGTHLNIAQHLLAGNVQYMAINQSTLLVARLPLFEYILAGMLLLGGGMASLRTLTGILGMLSVWLLYEVVCRIQNDRGLATLSALLLAIYPPALLYSRFGFSYNLLTPLVLLSYLALWEYRHRLGKVASQTKKALGHHKRWLALAALAIGMGTLCDLWMFTLFFTMSLVVLISNWRDLWWSVPLALLPFGCYVALMLLSVPQAFLFDLEYTFFRLQKLPFGEQWSMLTLNYKTLFWQDGWMAPAMVGLFMLRDNKLLTLLFFLLPITILGRTVALFSLSFYYMIPLLPFIPLGMASLLTRGIPYLAQMTLRAINASFSTRRALLISLILSLMVAIPLVDSLKQSLEQIHHGLSTPIDPFLLNPTDAGQTAAFINSQVAADDLIIASPTIAWLLQANIADFQMSAAFTGEETVHLPANIPPNRFAFAAHYSQAHWLIVDNLWHNWAVWHIAGVSDMMRNVENWPLLFQAGEIKVYCNPNKAECRTGNRELEGIGHKVQNDQNMSSPQFPPVSPEQMGNLFIYLPLLSIGD